MNPHPGTGDIRDADSTPRLEDPLEEEPLEVFLPGESHGQRSLASYSPSGCRVGQHWSDLACMQIGHTRTLFDLGLIIPHRQDPMHNIQWPIDPEGFLSGWWEQALFLALCESWALPPVLLNGSFLGLRELSHMHTSDQVRSKSDLLKILHTVFS